MAGQGTWTRPDPPGSGPDTTRPAVLVNIPDLTRPNPTRPEGRPDPGTTLVRRAGSCMALPAGYCSETLCQNFDQCRLRMDDDANCKIIAKYYIMHLAP